MSLVCLHCTDVIISFVLAAQQCKHEYPTQTAAVTPALTCTFTAAAISGGTMRHVYYQSKIHINVTDHMIEQ